MNYEKYLPFIDVEEGVNRLMNDMRIYTMVLKKFNGDTLFHDIKTAADAKDYQNLQLHAHTLKGTAANLSLKQVQELSFEIETSAKAAADPGTLLDDLKAALAETEAAIAAVLAGN